MDVLRRLTWGAVALTILAGCSVGGLGGSAKATSTPAASPLAVFVVGTDFAVGRNRFTFDVTQNGRPLTTAHPTVYFFSLHGFNAQPAGHGTANFEPVGQSASTRDIGVYVTSTTFNAAGKWGAEVDVVQGGKRHEVQAIFNVAKRSETPAIGEPAPRSNNPTVQQQPISKLDSGRPPDSMHSISIASSIAKHHALVVLFASAAYCGVFQCEAEISVVQNLAREYGSSVDFVHIDVFKNAHPPTLSATAVQWHIPSQPWVFVVDRSGRVLAKFEGLASPNELSAAIRKALASRS